VAALDGLILAHGSGTIVEVGVAVALLFLVIGAIVWGRRVEAREQRPPE
jgi:hypothetical protein